MTPDNVTSGLVVDPQLQFLASAVAARQPAELTLSLLVPGGLVSGVLIGEADYLDLLLAASSENARRTLEDLRRARRSGIDSPPSDPALYGYLHLRDAQFLAGAGMTATVGGTSLWRVRIDQVAGWSFLRMS